MSSPFKTVGVVGTGVIGASWTALFLAKGLKVLVSDPGPGAEEKLAAHLKSFWPTLETLGLSPGASLSNYEFVGPSLKGRYEEVDFVQENAPERPDLKNSVIGEIDAGTRPEVVIASSSSGIPSSQFLKECHKAPGRVLIGHPFNPPHLMPLVEVVPHPAADEAAVKTAIEFYDFVGKYPVHVKQEVPGHVVNRLQAAVCNEAFSLVARGVLSAESLDACMTTSLGPRWALTGPFMSNIMGGGGGLDGFKHILQHLGPATKVWTQDMEANAFDWSEASSQRVIDSVAEELKVHDTATVEKERDELLISLLKSKSATTSMV